MTKSRTRKTELLAHFDAKPAPRTLTSKTAQNGRGE